jgi:phosphoribosylamine--glycine ligase
MKILVVGKGGREHTFVWKIAQSPRVSQVYAAPGNPGMARHARCVDIGVDDIEGLATFAEKEGIDLTIIGPEDPLADGIVDRFREKGLGVVGPTQSAAQIEADKDFALALLHKYNIPTGWFETFTDPQGARDCVERRGAPIVLKASGLAAGKGVIVAQTKQEALEAIDEMMVKRTFGAAGDKLVVMEFLDGEEASIFGFTDGEHMVCLAPSQDHKAIYDGDKGPNTGGMGAYSPAPVVTQERFDEIFEKVMVPTVKALASEGRPYSGILYGGLIFTEDGPKVIEFNCRLGDPEAQAVLPLLKTDLVDIFTAINDGTLAELNVETEDRAATCVVLSSGGYPGNYETGVPITGIEDAEELGDVVVFHAGTAEKDGALVTDGGRVLGVTGIGDDIAAAIKKAYEAVDKIEFEGAYCRQDIGYRALERLDSKVDSRG